jgi:tight adherence protein B
LVALAAGWDVAQRSGAGLATALDRLGEGLRAAEQARAQLSGEVAAVRASARLLAALPAFGLLIGQVIGADPLAWLAGHWAGRIALVGGLVLQAVGLMWLNRVVAAARRAL